MNTFTHQGCIKLFKKSVKTYNITKYLYFKLMFFWIFELSKNPGEKSHIHKNVRQHFKKKKKSIMIGMISKGLCDTENWRNGCWKFIFAIAGINILKYINIFNKENSYFCNNIIFNNI